MVFPRLENRPPDPPAPPPAGRGQLGMSLVEALIAMALLLMVAIGILPLFTRAMINNAAGSEATNVANHARHRLEELGQLPFENVGITVAAGSQLLVNDVYFTGDHNLRGDELWAAAGAGTGSRIRGRATRVRQFQLVNPPGPIDNDLDGVVDDLGGLQDSGPVDGEFDDPLPATVVDSRVHVKEVTVELASPNEDPSTGVASGTLGSAPVYRVRTLRTF